MYKVGILTVSDKCSQGERKDSSPEESKLKNIYVLINCRNRALFKGNNIFPIIFLYHLHNILIGIETNSWGSGLDF